MDFNWNDLATFAEKDKSSLGRIVAVLCRHNLGQPGGSASIDQPSASFERKVVKRKKLKTATVMPKKGKKRGK